MIVDYFIYLTYGARKGRVRLFLAKLGDRAMERDVPHAARMGRTK